jgi:hypothetical protein
MAQLKPGDVLSYSSGRQDQGPYGFRVLRKGGTVMPLLARRWPGVLASFGGRTPIVINAYPATLGVFEFGVMVDSYMSLATGSRAMHLAALEKMPVMLLGQPCFVADLMYRHLAKNPVMPDTLIIGTGGYVMPRSLQNSLEELCRAQVQSMHVVQGYGVAEVDSSCMLAVTRDADGNLVYYPRDDVRVDLDGERLLLSLRGPDGDLVMDRFDGGDSARATPDGGYLIWNHERLHPHVLRILESWSPRDWERRTGYLYYGREIRFQLRKGFEPEIALEAEFHDYMKRYGQQWLFKPEWGRAKDAGRADPMRRTML